MSDRVVEQNEFSFQFNSQEKKKFNINAKKNIKSATEFAYLITLLLVHVVVVTKKS